MSLLENLKKRRAEENEAEKQEETPKMNPLAKLKAMKAAENHTSENAADKPINPILARMKARKQREAEEEAKKAAATSEENTEQKKPSLQEKAEAVVAEKLKDTSSQEEEPKEAEENEEKKEETATEEHAEKEEEKPKKRRRRRKTAKKEDESADAEDSKQELHAYEYAESHDLFGKKISYDEMAGAVMDYFIEDEWKKIQDEIDGKIKDIRIEPDMNPGTLKYVLAELNNLNDEIAAAYVEQKQLLEALTNKEFGAAVCLFAMSSRGSNSEERKANGFAALTDAKYGDRKVNLINLINATKMRLLFLDNISKRIQYKSNICITMSSAIKMEQSLMAGASAV